MSRLRGGGVLDHHDLAGLVREWRQQDRLHDAEDGGVRTSAEGKCHNRCQREAARPSRPMKK